MAKSIYILVLLSVASQTSLCQVLVQDATNTTSLLYQGTTINIDAAQAKASFSINSFANKTLADKSKHFYWGAQASVDSKKGLGGILKNGSIVPNADFKITLGKTWTNSKKDIESLDATISPLQLQIKEINEKANRQIFQLIELKEMKFTNMVKDSICQFFDDETFDSLNEKISNFRTKKHEKNDSTSLILLENKIRQILNWRNITKSPMMSRSLILRDEIKNYWVNRYVLYLIIEGSASKFTFLKNPTNLDYNKRFVDTTSQSPKFGIGFNWQRGGFSIFGISATHERSDNFYLLKEKEFVIINTDKTKSTADDTDPNVASTNTKIVEGKKSFTGYEGAYKTYWSTSFNCDYARFFPGGKSDNVTIVWHSYLRQSFSWYKEAFPELTKVGMGLYAFKDNGTFSGGLYVEINDVFNNVERLKKEPNFQPLYGRVNIGLVTKFALNSIISYR